MKANKILFILGLVAIISAGRLYSDSYEERLKEYVSGGRFNEGLESISKDDSIYPEYKKYLEALLKFYELKHWEKAQDWKNFYNQGLIYKKEIKETLNSLLEGEYQNPLLRIKAESLLGVILKNEGNDSYLNIYRDLHADIRNYLSQTQDMEGVLSCADFFYENQDKDSARKIYRTILRTVKNKQVSLEKLKSLGEKFYGSDRDFSASVYKIYLDRLRDVNPDEEYWKEIKRIFFMFCSWGFETKSESNFSLISDITSQFLQCGPVLDNALLYLCAFNSQRAKDYPQSIEFYKKLLDKTPGEIREEIIFKIALLSFFNEDRKNFLKYSSLLEKENPSSIYLGPIFYIKGILAHYEEDFASSQRLYGKSMKFSLDPGIPKLLERAKKNKPLPENIRIYLDLYFHKILPQGSTSISLSPAMALVSEPIRGQAQYFIPGLGCLQPQVVYLWWGWLGRDSYPSQNTFSASYERQGPQIIFCSIQTPTGFLDRDQELLEVYRLEIKGYKPAYKREDTLDIKVEIEPALWEEVYKLKLTLTQGDKVLSEGDSRLRYKLSSPGKYTLHIEIRTFQGKVLKEVSKSLQVF